MPHHSRFGRGRVGMPGHGRARRAVLRRESNHGRALTSTSRLLPWTRYGSVWPPSPRSLRPARVSLGDPRSSRFEVGRLPDGREEWLEFWRRNHLLPDFAESWARQERGPYGGNELGFLALEDLIRSKETVREKDWGDVALLEEVRDARHLAHTQDPGGVLRCSLDSGAEEVSNGQCALGLLADEGQVRQALQECHHPVSFAFLLPFARDAEQPGRLTSARG